jgi:1-acyl-sn-glycerol-3-phosphate acyltransferase
LSHLPPELPLARSRLIYPTLRFFTRVVARLLWRVSYRGRENLPDRGPLILAANHQSFLDPILIGAGIHLRPRYLVYYTYMQKPFLGRLARFFGGLPVGQGPPKRSLSAVRTALEAGETVEIFPEGGRSPDGSVYRFRRGFAHLSRVTGAPVVPVALLGANRAWPRNRTFPGPARVEIRFGPALVAPGYRDLPPAEAREADRRFAHRFRQAVLALAGGRLTATDASLTGTANELVTRPQEGPGSAG